MKPGTESACHKQNFPSSASYGILRTGRGNLPISETKGNLFPNRPHSPIPVGPACLLINHSTASSHSLTSLLLLLPTETAGNPPAIIAAVVRKSCQAGEQHREDFTKSGLGIVRDGRIYGFFFRRKRYGTGLMNFWKGKKHILSRKCHMISN